MKSRIWWLIAAGVLLMGVGMLGAAAFQTASQSPVPHGYDMISATAKTADGSVTADDITAIQTALEGSRLSWWANGTGAVGTDARTTQADVYAVTGAFQDFHRVDMLYGSFVPRSGTGNMAAVLSSDLAFRIFGTENAVGLEVKYQGRTFQVCGICKPDDSLVGLMSGNGMFRAYVSGADLVASGTLKIGGFEAMLPSGAPGESLSQVKAAMQTQSISTANYLIQDQTEQQRLDAETARLPMVLFWVSAALTLLVFTLGAARGIIRETVAVLKSDYFGNIWGSAAWGLAKLVLVIAAGAGLCALMWSVTGFNFYLPSKYIPGSWIDPAFYTDLIKSESQAAIAAQTYPKPWWDLAYTAAQRVASCLGTLSVLGFTVSALSLRALAAERRRAYSGPEATLKDIALLWLFAALSFGGAMGLTAATHMPLYTAFNGIVLLMAGLTAWAISLNRQDLNSLLYTNPQITEMPGFTAPENARQRV